MIELEDLRAQLETLHLERERLRRVVRAELDEAKAMIAHMATVIITIERERDTWKDRYDAAVADHEATMIAHEREQRRAG